MTDFVKLKLIGRSRPFLDALALIEKFAACDHTVLLQGETGTGKELAARAIHYLGARGRLPFIPINCGALPDTLIESELFGHVRGAFTDAREASPGLISKARGGTLFLDEIEAMTMRTQVSLLRFLQDGEFRPVGGTSTTTADVRVIGAANASLAGLAREGRFRADLLFRLNALRIDLPPLRERPGDVMLLAQHHLEDLNRRSGKSPKSLHPASTATLIGHDWPGNVRELENLILRSYLLEKGAVIRISPVELRGDAGAANAAQPSAPDWSFRIAKARAVAAFEQSYMEALLARSRGNLSLAARLSGKDRSDLSKLLRKHGIQRQAFERDRTSYDVRHG
jgi:two-component system, NtrC family, response regulator GlrR